MGCSSVWPSPGWVSWMRGITAKRVATTAVRARTHAASATHGQCCPTPRKEEPRDHNPVAYGPSVYQYSQPPRLAHRLQYVPSMATDIAVPLGQESRPPFDREPF